MAVEHAKMAVQNQNDDTFVGRKPISSPLLPTKNPLFYRLKKCAPLCSPRRKPFESKALQSKKTQNGEEMNY